MVKLIGELWHGLYQSTEMSGIAEDFKVVVDNNAFESDSQTVWTLENRNLILLKSKRRKGVNAVYKLFISLVMIIIC